MTEEDLLISQSSEDTRSLSLGHKVASHMHNKTGSAQHDCGAQTRQVQRIKVNPRADLFRH
jgi:hypothetical protein